MKGCCECCLRHADVEPAIHHASGRHIYVCFYYECLVEHSTTYTRINWRAQWEAHMQAQEALRKQQEGMRKLFGHVA